MSRPQEVSRAPLSVLLALSASACMSWRVEPNPLPAPLDGRTLSQIRILSRSHATLVVVYDARLNGDSIVGLTRPRSDPNAERIAIAARDVVEVETPVGDAWKTIYSTVAVVGIVVATLTLAAVLACAAAA